MNWQALPPLPALRAFGAFVDTGSLVQAGAALNVSHAAISQQLRQLEQHLNVTLFDRSGRKLELTAAGHDLADATRVGFQKIIDATDALTGADAARPLHVSTTATFAASWLMPRLGAFRQQQPDIDIMIDPSPELVGLAPGGVDVAIRHGTGNWPGLDSTPLLLSPLVLVGSPDLIGARMVDAPADLAEAPWLEEFGTSEASRWLEMHGVTPGRARSMIRLPGNLMLDAARNGQGVAVVVRAFVEADLKAGRLVELFRQETENSGYYIVTRPGVHRAPLQAFLRWLRRQRAAEQKDT